MSDARIELVVTDRIARLTLRRPEKLNAIDADMVDALLQACRTIERSDAVVAILSGQGERSFCAGGDIDAWSSLDADRFSRRWLRDGHDAFDALARLSVPLIAVLNGHALGGGLELAACADLRIAEAHVKIGQPEPGLGIIPGWSGTQRASRRFGAQLVRRMALFGEVYGAGEALSLGLVDRVVVKGEGLAAAQVAAERVLQRSPRATELTKMLINAAEGEESERVVEALAGAVAAASSDLMEGLAAYRQKRSPKFNR
ncbi:enoyl-CoA hydratase/isomerase family protein [Ensifer adhaerens]|uniref:enoyl-CoA hydratase/isomerase family protein n=1 Tax=Ensifer adhaerens TaxID=106592 RepID=UPI000B5B5A1C|nr:enoyl-CoA hydratase/isomerase family protein [Ensifer adhaerens]OWZ89523.1 enoyl-CoA hydratase [Sinorhizobium sp. LM21]QHG74258.1 enoyl-CoA hydratase/isomerase family protein [Ensifer adhaerens]RAS02539.1 enoyl-CoA hydratase/carnithine racemase [Ensifer adhaerens]